MTNCKSDKTVFRVVISGFVFFARSNSVASVRGVVGCLYSSVIVVYSVDATRITEPELGNEK